jgi:cell division protein FtsB
MKKLPRTQQILYLSLTFFVVMILVAVFHEDGILTVLKLEEDLVELKDSNEKLRDENKGIRREIKLLKNDPFAIEKIAREKLRMVKPGETVYQIVRQDPEDSNY